MALTLLRAPERAVAPVVFGKLPHRADCIRINAAHPVAAEFGQCLQGVLDRFQTQGGWEERYDLAPMVDFCCPSRDQRWIFTGAWIGSHDQSMRRHPLVAGAAFPASRLGNERRLVPTACEAFFEGLRERLSNALDTSIEAMACRQYLDAQTTDWDTGAADFHLASETMQRFLDNHPPAVLAGPLAAEGEPCELAQALLNLAFYRDFLRRFCATSSLQVIELPLGGGRGEAALHASAWLSILSVISGGHEPWAGGFLLKQGRDRARLYASFGPLPEGALLLATGGEVPENARLDLAREQKTWQAHARYAETAYALERFLSAPDVTLSGLLAFLGNAGQKIAFSNH